MADQPKLTVLGKVVILMFILACFGGAYYMLGHKFSFGNPLAKSGAGASSGSPSIFGGGASAEIGIAYGTEKRRWLEWAVEEFGKTSDGKNVKVNLIPMGSIEGAHALLSGDQRLNVWSPQAPPTKTSSCRTGK